MFLHTRNLRLQFIICFLASLFWHSPCFGQGDSSRDQQAGAADQQIPPAIARQIEALERRIEQLEAELAKRKAQDRNSSGNSAPETDATTQAASLPTPAPGVKQDSASSMQAQSETTPARSASGQAEKKKAAEPFAFADFTWLNGNPRTKDVPMDTKFFTPEIRFDAAYTGFSIDPGS